MKHYKRRNGFSQIFWMGVVLLLWLIITLLYMRVSDDPTAYLIGFNQI